MQCVIVQVTTSAQFRPQNVDYQKSFGGRSESILQ